MRLPAQAARQLPTTLRVDSSSTDDSRLRGALPTTDLSRCSKQRLYAKAFWASTMLGSRIVKVDPRPGSL